MTHDEMIAVIEHHKKGGKVEYRTRQRPGRWFDIHTPDWMFDHYDYRPKREPAVAWGVVWHDGNVSPNFFMEREDAEDYAEEYSVSWGPSRVIKMVEVVE